jgi:hypothetical protein
MQSDKQPAGVSRHQFITDAVAVMANSLPVLKDTDLPLITDAAVNAEATVAESAFSDSQAIVIYDSKSTADGQHLADFKARAIADEAAIVEARKGSQHWSNERAKAEGQCRVSCEACTVVRKQLTTSESERKSLQKQYNQVMRETRALLEQTDFAKDCLEDETQSKKAQICIVRWTALYCQVSRLARPLRSPIANFHSVKHLQILVACSSNFHSLKHLQILVACS